MTIHSRTGTESNRRDTDYKVNREPTIPICESNSGPFPPQVRHPERAFGPLQVSGTRDATQTSRMFMFTFKISAFHSANKGIVRQDITLKGIWES